MIELDPSIGIFVLIIYMLLEKNAIKLSFAKLLFKTRLLRSQALNKHK